MTQKNERSSSEKLQFFDNAVRRRTLFGRFEDFLIERHHDLGKMRRFDERITDLPTYGYSNRSLIGLEIMGFDFPRHQIVLYAKSDIVRIDERDVSVFKYRFEAHSKMSY